MTWATGFRGIVEYLRKKSEGQANLDALLSDIEKADCIAYAFTPPPPLCEIKVSIISANVNTSAPIQLLGVPRKPWSITHRSLSLRLGQKL